MIAVGVLAFFFSIALIKQPPEPPQELQDVIVVKVMGEVDNPGYHTFARRTRLKDILHVVKPRFDAEAAGLNEDSVLHDGQAVRFKSLLVKVRVRGAVKAPGDYMMRKGALLSDYLDRLELADDADIEKVQNRMVKRQNQTITVPAKKGRQR